MSAIQKTSILLCLAILIVGSGVALVTNWQKISVFSKTSPVQPSVEKSTSSPVDPFRSSPPLPSLVKDLDPAYTIKAELQTNQAKIVGTETIQFDNPGTKEIHLYVYDYGWSPMRVISIRHGETKIAFQRRGSVVSLSNKFPTDTRIALTVEFETAIPRSATRFGTKDDIWTLTNWYPMLGALDGNAKWYEPPRPVGYGDPFVYHYADYDVRFLSPEGYRWVSSWGRGERVRLAGGQQEIHYQGKELLNFSLVGSPLYHIEQIKIGNLTVDIALSDKKSMPQVKAIAESALTAFSDMYGELPYPYVSIAETGHTYAMEYANLAIFSKNMYANNEINHWLPHEIAHLWWYNSVSTLEAETGWIDEGLVEWSVYLYMQKRHGQAMADTVMGEYQREYETLQQRYPDGKLSKTLRQFTDYYEFDWTWYAKGAVLYDQLRRQIGEAPFASFLQRVQRNYHGKVIGPQHLDQALSQILNGTAAYFVPNQERTNRQPIVPLAVEYYVDTVINGVPYYPSVPGREVGETVYLPLRDVMEKIGYQVTWVEKKGMIRLHTSQKEVLLSEKSAEVTFNGKPYQLPHRLLEIDDRTMVPLSFFEQVLAYQVEYDNQSKVVRITVPPK
ncbi:aminopeptidase [Brevibacillus humidisoli]|uniref:stalk domain-containing protein n=1 Tax=Brevibacillus humidisoli TaxID=2895522 RepID=UPI001E573B2E|nr:stalk domain-containing protein [Brevibacillus humidisoli]UFJ42952.1 aminopeptidase [Brevibacillus humidisoli]